ncbi:MAG: AHH domain-containing protein [Lewinellaceae bacterium]|nr:AHH domain-containing protein [Lewinellaceae bacterium]
MEVFLQNGGTLPPGLDITRAKHLLEINQVYHLNQSNLHWLADNTLILDVIYNYFINHPTPTGDDLNAISRFITLISNYGLNISQQLYLAGHLDKVGEFSSFAVSKDYDYESQISIKLMLDLHQAGQMPVQYESQAFRQIIDQYPELSNGVWPDGLGALWNYAYSIERAKLKYHNPSWSSLRLDLEAAWNVSKEAIHLALDGFGLIPVIGEVADIASAFIYTMEGDWQNATLSVASAVPFWGWFAQGAKHCQKVVNAGGNISKLIWKADNLGKVTFGNSVQLTRMIKPVTDFHAHHIIPWIRREHPIVQSAAKVDGSNPWHMNEAGNGIGIHKNYHAGSTPDAHPAYNAAILQKLDNIKNYFGGNFTPTQAYAELEKLRQATRIIITSNPTTHINNLSFTTWPSVLGAPPAWW